MRLSRAALPAIFLAGLAACAVTPDPPEVAACKYAVAAQSASGAGTTLVSSEPVIDGNMVKIQDNGTGTVWRCITDSAGAVSELDIDY